MSITLTQTIGATTMDVCSAGLPGPSAGVALRFELYDGSIAFALTDEEAQRLVAEIQIRIARAGGPIATRG